MIDVSQWRASIGLWNYCQAASSRPTNGYHSHSFKAAVDSKSGSTTSGEKTSKLPAALSLIAFLHLLFLSLFLLRHVLISPIGNCYQVQCTTGVTVTDTNYLQSVVLPGGSSSNLIYNVLYLIVCLRMHLLLSGDVELNPGPMIDDQPSCPLFARCLEPLVDWEPFALSLPGGITQLDVDIIKTKGSSYLRMEALHKRWLQANPTASWRDVINALKQCKENELARTIEDKVTDLTAGRSTNDDMEVSTSNANPGPITGNPKDILRTHSSKLVDGISINIPRTAYALYAEGLIPQQTKQEMLVSAVDNFTKAANLMNVIEKQLESSLNPEQYLTDTCHVLINQQHRTLTDIATSILHQLGQSIPDNVSSHTVLPSPVDDIPNTPVTDIRGNPKDILRIHSVKLTDAISDDLFKIINEFHAARLIPKLFRQKMQVIEKGSYTKSTKFVKIIEQQLESSDNPGQYLIDICHVLINQQHRTLRGIATSILHQLGQPIPDNVSSHTVLPSPVEDTSNAQDTNTR
uniref:Death domain-containing protein n=1 Tax=Amphimedon queenslandica TaxID=400682 RepID=A0A1X7SVP3_AMPQE